MLFSSIRIKVAQILATVAELVVEDGNITGKLFEKSGGTIKEGSMVRARVNGMTD